MHTKEVQELIKSNRSDIAFLIGNGIHRYNNRSAITWESMLLDLWNTTQPTSIQELPKGISFTEFYDVLDFRCQEQRKKKDNTMFAHVSLLPVLERQKEYLKDISKKNEIPSWYINISEKELDAMIEAEKKGEAKYNLQKYIAAKLSEWEPNEHQKTITQSIHNIQAPILTTNYDRILSNSIENCELKRIKDDGFTDFYPWSSYYSDEELENPTNGFGIWHINGMIKYHRSIALGLSQYMGAVARARQWIQGSSDEELFSGKAVKKWKGYETWLHIIFNKKLFIFGLSLAENETFLRWLLIQRAKYFKKFKRFDDDIFGWFIIPENEKKGNEGRTFFLENIGIKVITLPNYDAIYKNIWENL